MTRLEQLVKSVQETELLARHLITDAANAGQFEAVTDLAQFALDLSNLANRWTSSSKNGIAPIPLSASVSNAKQTAIPSPTTTSKLPEFHFERDELVKRGLSTGERLHYEHRVPKRSADSIIKTIFSLGRNGRRFSATAAIETVTKATGAESFPSYQLYAVLSWLKWCGLLLQHGRQGYTIVKPATFMNSVDTAWKALPRR